MERKGHVPIMVLKRPERALELASSLPDMKLKYTLHFPPFHSTAVEYTPQFQR